MARKKKASADTVLEIRARGEPTGTAIDEDDELADLDELEGGDLARALGEKLTVEGARAELVRIVDGSKVEFCQLYPVSVFSKEQVATDWGPGRYRVRFKDGDNKFIKGGFNFAVAARPGGAAPAQQPSGVQDMLAVMRAQSEKDADRWFKWATLLATTVGPKLVEGLFGRQSSSKEVLEMMVAMRELTSKEPGPSTIDRLSELREMMGMVRDMKDDSGGGTGTTGWDLLKEGIGSVKPLLERLAGGAGPAGTPPAAGPPGTVAAPPAALPIDHNVPRGTSDADVNLKLAGWLKGTLEVLLVQAVRNRDPALYAEVTLDQLPDFVPVDALQGFLAKDDWWTVVTQFDARLVNHRPWFSEFRDAVLKLLAEDHSAPPAPGTPGPEPDLEGV